MTEDYPVPPPELVGQWREEAAHRQYSSVETDEHIAEQAARWGADQELEACCLYLERNFDDWDNRFSAELRLVRRAKPTLAKRALHILGSHGDLSPAEHDRIRRALESLPD